MSRRPKCRETIWLRWDLFVPDWRHWMNNPSKTDNWWMCGRRWIWSLGLPRPHTQITDFSTFGWRVKVFHLIRDVHKWINDGPYFSSFWLLYSILLTRLRVASSTVSYSLVHNHRSLSVSTRVRIGLTPRIFHSFGLFECWTRNNSSIICCVWACADRKPWKGGLVLDRQVAIKFLELNFELLFSVKVARPTMQCLS